MSQIRARTSLQRPVERRKKESRKPVDPSLLSPMAQLRVASKPQNRISLISGILLGGIVPILTYCRAHFEVNPEKPYFQVTTYLVLGGLLFSAKSVYSWGREAFNSPAKALGFLVLAEGVMVFSSIQILSLVSLLYLIAINAVSTGVNLAIGVKKQANPINSNNLWG